MCDQNEGDINDMEIFAEQLLFQQPQQAEHDHYEYYEQEDSEE